jgi:hypothetical protein
MSTPSGKSNPGRKSGSGRDSNDHRRLLVLILAIGLLVTSGLVTWYYGKAGSAKFVAAATGRIGLVMAALWLAWPSLRRPAQWLPPGMAVIGVILLAVLAAQPRLIIVAIPAFGVLLTTAMIIRSMKR